jgi:PPIC-type PPIASE domain
MALSYRYAWFLLLLSCSSSTPPVAAAPKSKGAVCLADARPASEPPRDAPARIEVRHILVRHSELSDPKGASRSREAACLQALQALEALQGGTLDWDAAVARFSDTQEHDLGRVAVDDLNPDFAGAAFSLEVDQLSYVTETDRGFHVILRTR